MWQGFSEEGNLHDRRSNPRFQVQQELRYATLNGRQSGIGKMLDISSAGLSFTTPAMLPAGTSLELAINWPVQFNASYRIQLIISGLVIRSSEEAVVVAIHCHEFRTNLTAT